MLGALPILESACGLAIVLRAIALVVQVVAVAMVLVTGTKTCFWY